MAAEKKKTERPAAVTAPAAVMAERPQPHDLEAERAVLAAILRDPGYCGSTAVEKLKKSTVFYSQIHREIFESFKRVYASDRKGVDLLALADDLRREGKLEQCGGLEGLAQLQNSIATTYNFEYWCELVNDSALLRDMIGVCSQAIVQCYEDRVEAGKLVNQIEDDIYKVREAQATSSIVTLKESAHQAFIHISKIINHEEESGIPTGFPDLDRRTGGLKKGEMFVLAARPSIGKTSMALNIVRNIVLNQAHPRKVLFFSLEMTDEQISTRLICTEANVSEREFRDGSFNPTRDLPKLTGAVNVLRNAPLFIDPTGGLTISEVRAKARRMRKQHGIELVVLDYLQLMQGNGREESRQLAVAEISGGLKSLAKELKIPVLVLAQLNREVEKGVGSTRPKLSHLRESGAIEQDADVVAFLHRDRDKAKDLAPGQSVDAELIIEKNRNGETGIVPLQFFPARMEFVNSQYSAKDDPPARRGANQA